MSDLRTFLESYLRILNSNGFKGGCGRFCYSKFLAFLQNNNKNHAILVDSKPFDSDLKALNTTMTIEIISRTLPNNINNRDYENKIAENKIADNKIIDNLEPVVILFLTNDNWQKYKYEQSYYKNIVFIGPVAIIGHQWLCNAHYTTSIQFYLPNLTSIGTRMLNGCLINCTELTHLDFRGLSLLESIGWDMFAQSRVEYNVCPVPKLKSIWFNYRENLSQGPLLKQLGFNQVTITGPAHLENIKGQWWLSSNSTRVQLTNLFFGKENWQEWKESQDRDDDLALEKVPIQISKKDIVVDSLSYVTHDGVVCDIEPSKSGRKIVLTGPIRYYEMETIKSYIFNGALYEHSFDIRV